MNPCAITQMEKALFNSDQSKRISKIHMGLDAMMKAKLSKKTASYFEIVDIHRHEVTLFGFPVVQDDSIPYNVFEFRDQQNKVLLKGEIA